MELYTPEVYISEEKIAQRIQALGSQITQDYFGEELVVICILKGAFVFCTDLVRKINLPIKIDYIALTESSIIESDISTSIEGKHVLLVEDIVDTGHPLFEVIDILSKRRPRSLKTAVLLFRPDKLKCIIPIDYLAFDIEDQFVVGYGLDYGGRYRELPYIGVLNAGH